MKALLRIHWIFERGCVVLLLEIIQYVHQLVRTDDFAEFHRKWLFDCGGRGEQIRTRHDSAQHHLQTMCVIVVGR